MLKPFAHLLTFFWMYATFHIPVRPLLGGFHRCGRLAQGKQEGNCYLLFKPSYLLFPSCAPFLLVSLILSCWWERAAWEAQWNVSFCPETKQRAVDLLYFGKGHRGHLEKGSSLSVSGYRERLLSLLSLDAASLPWWLSHDKATFPLYWQVVTTRVLQLNLLRTFLPK